MKSSITKVQIKQKLYTYHIAGDDRNLADHGNEREYLYSVGDGYRLLLDIREKQLNRGNTFLAAANEQNAAFRENHKRIFLSDPYYTNSFDEYFEDDISRPNFNELTKSEIHLSTPYLLSASAKHF